MNKTKEKILNKALELYNKNGVTNTSLRQLAKELQLSHSNVLYHFPSQEDVILGLHDQIAKQAASINTSIFCNNTPLEGFFEHTKVGFGVVYDYRFLFLELPIICATYPKIKQIILEVEPVREQMYRSLIEKLMDEKLMRNEAFPGEFSLLINTIKLFSDHWVTSSNIYDQLSRDKAIDRYAFQFIGLFYPYLSSKGQLIFRTVFQQRLQ